MQLVNETAILKRRRKCINLLNPKVLFFGLVPRLGSNQNRALTSQHSVFLLVHLLELLSQKTNRKDLKTIEASAHSLCTECS